MTLLEQLELINSHIDISKEDADARKLRELAVRRAEIKYQALLEEAEVEDNYCYHCSGSGEGQHDGTRCMWCKGRGIL